ncbi:MULTISPECIES: magnesium transporter CorA family protein [Brucella]|jgi:magnesium transporter|uniref:Magnesium transport protein CorA n=3 Tax=Brucella TaxID=234 RepID=A0A1A9FJY9_9HYPH|nr:MULTISPECIES: magnesium transporter CorA family protein [Brucella]EMG54988.1 Mg2 transporter protein CorA family protein [Ochrobactrum sp. CDB2]MBK0020518.1 magnesium transporter CorA family protein [Ochrobactrum sp. S45]MBK0042742.1 magnesium transporter CorA family protein [Ochrobactrum sp. S46]MBO1024327.1 magnesium transporter CorA family protein [Ochrobactrum sp. SD129]MQP41826.1 magnesium transporter CorA [Ochrobactrum sp. MYb237]QWK78168.1 magnesium transporter CorA family protein [
MITLYCLNGDHLDRVEVEPGNPLPENVIWIDLLAPGVNEDHIVEAWTGISIPTREDMTEIEESSRFYMENGAQYLTVPILHAVDLDHRELAPVTFILHGQRLVTVRYADPKSVSIYITRATKPGNGLIPNAKCSGLSIMLGIIEATTNRLADILEGVAGKIDAASHSIYRRQPKARPMTTEDFRHILTQIGGQGTFLSRMRESLAGISRMLVYLSAINSPVATKKDTRSWVKSLERDAQSLVAYVDFLSNKVTFLLDTIVGLISVEQNAIIKIFSVAAVGFMPPTLVASIYGMNFSFMPELNSPWGYPMALGLMVASALLPLFYFRRKGWL